MQSLTQCIILETKPFVSLLVVRLHACPTASPSQCQTQELASSHHPQVVDEPAAAAAIQGGVTALSQTHCRQSSQGQSFRHHVHAITRPDRAILHPSSRLSTNPQRDIHLAAVNISKLLCAVRDVQMIWRVMETAATEGIKVRLRLNAAANRFTNKIAYE